MLISHAIAWRLRFSGLYLCEFITFNSTATAKHNARSLDLPEIPVQFIHVPAYVFNHFCGHHSARPQLAHRPAC